MNLEQYVQGAIRTESRVDEVKVGDRYAFVAVLRAFVAASELLDMYKKNIYYKKPINEDKWYTARDELQTALRELTRGTYLPLTATDRDTVNIDPRVLHSIIGIATESGELVDAVVKHLEYDKPLDRTNVLEEIGDLNWYQAIAVDSLNADWEQIQETNIAKLKARYPEKFTSENAINRDLEAERKILEQGHEQLFQNE